MNLLSLLLILILNVQFCNATSGLPVLNSSVFGESPLSANFKGQSPMISTPGDSDTERSSSLESGSPHSDTEKVLFFPQDSELLLQEEACARQLFEKVAAVVCFNDCKQMQQVFEQLSLLVQEEKVARSLFERILFVELNSQMVLAQEQDLRALIVKKYEKTFSSLKRLFEKSKDLEENRIYLRRLIEADEAFFYKRLEGYANMLKKGITSWEAFSALDKDDFSPLHPCLLNKDSSFLVRFFKLLISA